MKANPHKIGLTLGIYAGLIHVVWSLLMLLGVAKALVDWILSLHFLEITYSLADFNLGNAVLLVAMTFVCGYVAGYVLAWIWNWLGKK